MSLPFLFIQWDGGCRFFQNIYLYISIILLVITSLKTTGTACYMGDWQAWFHFNALGWFRQISVNSVRFNEITCWLFRREVLAWLMFDLCGLILCNFLQHSCHINQGVPVLLILIIVVEIYYKGSLIKSVSPEWLLPLNFVIRSLIVADASFHYDGWLLKLWFLHVSSVEITFKIEFLLHQDAASPLQRHPINTV
jgi:hypothetical protein